MLLRRQLARAPRITRRQLATTVLRSAAPVSTRAERTGTLGGKSALDTHTTEDLQGIAIQEILAEEGSSMRHFTGGFSSSKP
jgi:hypothetical protein